MALEARPKTLLQTRIDSTNGQKLAFTDLSTRLTSLRINAQTLKKGGPYPNKTMFVTDLHEFTISDGSYVEGARKALAVMVKDSKKYASTGGWSFQLWEGGDPKKPVVTDAAKQCFECHQPKKDNDYVYSTYIQ